MDHTSQSFWTFRKYYVGTDSSSWFLWSKHLQFLGRFLVPGESLYVANVPFDCRNQCLNVVIAYLSFHPKVPGCGVVHFNSSKTLASRFEYPHYTLFHPPCPKVCSCKPTVMTWLETVFHCGLKRRQCRTDGLMVRCRTCSALMQMMIWHRNMKRNSLYQDTSDADQAHGPQQLDWLCVWAIRWYYTVEHGPDSHNLTSTFGCDETF